MLSPDVLPLWGRFLGRPTPPPPPPPGTYVAVALAGERVVGHVCVFRQWERSDVGVPGWWLTGLEVNPQWRGRKVGRQLVERVMERWAASEGPQDLYLVVHRRNRPAINLFRSCGFREFHREDWRERLARVYARKARWDYVMMVRPGDASVGDL